MTLEGMGLPCSQGISPWYLGPGASGTQEDREGAAA